MSIIKNKDIKQINQQLKNKDNKQSYEKYKLLK